MKPATNGRLTYPYVCWFGCCFLSSIWRILVSGFEGRQHNTPMAPTLKLFKRVYAALAEMKMPKMCCYGVPNALSSVPSADFIFDV
ncbi:hypothetical protein DPMN_072380 [Dreissena polymorpha]|uniref:Uncharacterized protein n=1 Tax=Dreissena polymorpha TaxID=45954 RepID=A0A9D3Z3V5_DREPO|nr:hypothetical protein DPMN_072380 [Dreissena polymorpha]